MSYEAWDETEPAGADAAGGLHNYIQKFRRQVRERLAGVFSDWSTATDRIVITKLFIDGTNGLTFRDSTDANDFGKITKDGYFQMFKPYACMLTATNAFSGAYGGGNLAWNAGPTEVADPLGMHSGSNIWRITVPEAGVYKFNLQFNLLTDAAKELNHSFTVAKNGSAFVPRNYQTPITSTTVTVAATEVLSLAANDYCAPMFYNMVNLATYNFNYCLFSCERIT